MSSYAYIRYIEDDQDNRMVNFGLRKEFCVHIIHKSSIISLEESFTTESGSFIFTPIY